MLSRSLVKFLETTTLAGRDISNRMNYSKRIGMLRRRMGALGLPGLLVTHLPEVRYLCGFTGSSAALAVTRRAVRLFTDGRYTAQAAEEVQAAKVEIVPSAPAVAALLWLAVQVSVGDGAASVGFDSAHTSVAELERLKAALP